MCTMLPLVTMLLSIFVCVANGGHFFLQPSSTEVIEGSTVTFTCGTRSVVNCPGDGIQWHRYIATTNFVAKCYRVEPNSEERVTVELDMRTGKYQLHINNVRIEDSGDYWCLLYFDDYQHASNHALLVVKSTQSSYLPSTDPSTVTPDFKTSVVYGNTVDDSSSFTSQAQDESPTTDTSEEQSTDGSPSTSESQDEFITTMFMRQHEHASPLMALTPDQFIPSTQTDFISTKPSPLPAATATLQQNPTNNEDSVRETGNTSLTRIRPRHTTGPDLPQVSIRTSQDPKPDDDEDNGSVSQPYPVWIILGCSLALALLLVAIVSCTRFLVKKTRKVVRSRNAQESQGQGQPGDEGVTASTSVLHTNTIYEGLAQDSEAQLDQQDTRETPVDEAYPAVLYAAPDKTGRGVIRHYTAPVIGNNSRASVASVIGTSVVEGVTTSDPIYAKPY